MVKKSSKPKDRNYKPPKEYKQRIDKRARKGKSKWEESKKGKRAEAVRHVKHYDRDIQRNIDRFCDDFALIYDLWEDVQKDRDLDEHVE